MAEAGIMCLIILSAFTYESNLHKNLSPLKDVKLLRQSHGLAFHMFALSTILWKVALMVTLVDSNTNVMRKGVMTPGQSTPTNTFVGLEPRNLPVSAMYEISKFPNVSSEFQLLDTVGGHVFGNSQGRSQLDSCAAEVVDSTFDDLLPMPWSYYTQVRTARVTECYKIWVNELESDSDKEYLLNGILSGFDIVDSAISEKAT
jgi:hypothetical protein